MKVEVAPIIMPTWRSEEAVDFLLVQAREIMETALGRQPQPPEFIATLASCIGCDNLTPKDGQPAQPLALPDPEIAKINQRLQQMHQIIDSVSTRVLTPPVLVATLANLYQDPEDVEESAKCFKEYVREKAKKTDDALIQKTPALTVKSQPSTKPTTNGQISQTVQPPRPTKVQVLTQEKTGRFVAIRYYPDPEPRQDISTGRMFTSSIQTLELFRSGRKSVPLPELQINPNGLYLTAPDGTTRNRFLRLRKYFLDLKPPIIYWDRKNKLCYLNETVTVADYASLSKEQQREFDSYDFPKYADK